MESNLEIWVEINGTKSLLDTNGVDVISLNYSLADIQDISKRNSSFSKTIVIPDSKGNREAFNSISELTSDSLFNQNLKTPCWIYSNGLLVFRGNLQLKNVVQDFVSGFDTLEVVVYNETETFISSMGERYLSDLDLSYLDHTWNYDNIAYSWTQSWEHGYFYPLIDNGMNYSEANIGDIGPPPYLLIGTSSGVYVNNLKPAVYVKTIMDRIFLDSGYTFRSEFFNSDYFKKMIIPHNGADILAADSVLFNNFKVELVSSPGYTSAGNYTTINSNSNRINFTDILLNENNVYQASPTYSFVQPSEIYIQSFGTNISVNCLVGSGVTGSISSPSLLLGTSSIFCNNVSIKFRRDSYGINGNIPVNGGEFYTNNGGYAGTPLVSLNWTTPNPGTIPDSGVMSFQPFYEFTSGYVNAYEFFMVDDKIWASFSFSILTDDLDNRYDVQNGKYSNLITGDKVDVIIYMNYGIDNRFQNLMVGTLIPLLMGYPMLTGGDLLLSNNSSFYNTIVNRLIPGATLNLQSSLSRKFKQKDFFKSLITMFNLFIEPDKNNNKILNIEPRDDYYSDGLTLDWSDKIDISSINLSFVSDYQSKKTILTYKTDSDYQNKTYKEQTEEVYGEYTEEFDNEFIFNENKLETSFSPTPIVAIGGSGYFPMSRISKDQNGGTFESNLRIMFRNYLPLEGAKNYFVIWKPLSDGGGYQIEYSYPWAGHLDHPYRPVEDLNFGQVYTSRYRWQSTANTLANKFWKNYLDLINDTNSRLLQAKFYLNESDISNLSFKDTIYLDLNGRRAKFLINKINNYNPTMTSTCDVELIKI